MPVLASAPASTPAGTSVDAGEDAQSSDGPDKPSSRPSTNHHSDVSKQQTATSRPLNQHSKSATSDSSSRTITAANLGKGVDPARSPPSHPPVPVRSKSEHGSKANGVLKRMFRPGFGKDTHAAATPPLDFKDLPAHHAIESVSIPPTPSTPDVDFPEWVSPPPSAPPSRAPSIASKKGGGSRKSSFSKSDAPPSMTAKGPPSTAGSDAGGGQRFNLKDLLASGPKLTRKPSASSRKSDASSDRGGGGASAHGAESTASLLKKYGVCEKVAIGKGATSVVKLAHKWDRSEEKLYAVKEFRKRRSNETEKEYVKKLTAEFCISSTLHHKNIVETVDLVQDENQHWCEVMEYCPGGDLYAAIKKGGMSPSEVECCFKQILTGLSYLHAQGVAHRDIKPENLYFDTRGHVKIGDYGASTVYRLPWEGTVHMSTGLCGSEPYIAPEQFLGKPYDARLVDIWAVGVVYYCLLFQELPWRVAQTSDPLFAAHQAACVAAPWKGGPALPASYPTVITNITPRESRPLLRRMLDPDPKIRCAIEEVMSHSWIKSVEVCTEVPSPKHGHSNVRVALQQPVVPIE